MKKFIVAAGAAFFAVWGAMGALTSGPATGWYEPQQADKPFVRWWWHGSAVDTAGLRYNLEEFARQGIGGVEITPIYGVKGNENNDIPYLSDRWMEMLRFVTGEGRRLGVQIDMNNGTGWPFGGPEVSTDDAARKLVVEAWLLPGGKKLKEPIVVSDEQQRPVATLQRVIAAGGGRRIDVTRHVGADGQLHWRAPKGRDWKIYALFSGRTFMKVKRAAPGGEGLVVNHYDSVALKKYLSRFDRAFQGNEDIIPHTFFNDSFELHTADWDDRLLDEFKRVNGYKLEDYIPEFLGDTDDPELRGRILSDYRRVLGDMLEKNFTLVWKRWANSHGALVRNQSHGSPANIIDLYADVDIPECESFGATEFDIPGLPPFGPSHASDSDPAVLRFASSASAIAGKPRTSAEALTWLTEHFRTPLSRCKPELDQLFCSGVNHVYFHGAPYSPKNAKFPGWLFYASINMSPTNSFWRDAPELFKYIERCQSFLAAGKPDTDYLLYFPIEDIWAANQEKPFLMFAIHKMDKTMPGVKKAVREITDTGFEMDYLSDRLIDSLSVTDGGRIMSRGGNSYRAVIVPGVKYMPPATLKRLVKMAREGATVMFAGKLPQSVPGLAHADRNSLEFADAIGKLPGGESDGVYSLGKGRVIKAADIQSAIALSGDAPEPLRGRGVSMTRRRNEVGGWNYFLSMLRNDSIDGPVRIATEARSAMLFDPLTGASGKVAAVEMPGGGFGFNLQLKPGQTLLLKTFPTDVEAPAWRYASPAAAPVGLSRGWSISFPESEPPIEETFDIDTIADWTTLPDPRAKVNSATARYSTEVSLPRGIDADDWEIDLGNVRESARVYVNGQYAGTAWCAPFRLRIGEFLRPGSNKLDIDVTNLQANRIADYERRGVEWRIFKNANIKSVTGAKEFSFGDWETIPSGLTSTVRLIPLRLTENP